MLNLLLFFLGLTCIFLIARYNGSNKLFWILLISMMSGFIGGTVAANIGNDEQVNVSTVSTDNGILTTDFLLFEHKSENISFEEPWVEITKQYENTGAVAFTSVPSKSGFFKPRQKPGYIDTS